VRNVHKNIVTLFTYLTLSMILWSGNLFASEVDDLMNQANNYFLNQQYTEAIEVYNQIIERGYESDALYYNLGNSHFRLGRLGYAILFYEKAVLLSPGDEDIEYNLRIVNARIVDKINEVPEIFIVEWWDILVSSLTTGGWLSVVFIIYFLMIIFIGIYFLVDKIRLQRFAILGGLFSFIILLVVIIITFSSYHRDNYSNHGVLLSDNVTAKLSPDDNSGDAFVIHEGIKFEINDQLNDWSEIRLADGKVGWVPNRSFEKI